MTTPCPQPYSTSQYAVVAVLSAASSFISFLACCFVFCIIVLFKKWKFFEQRLILYLNIAAILESTAVIIHRVDYKNQTSAFYTGWCVFAGFFENNSSWMLLLAVVVITVHLFALAVFNKPSNKFEPLYVFIIFVLPLLFNWIGFIGHAYGKAGAWCWIRSENPDCSTFKYGEVLRFVDWYIPLYVTLIILIVLYIIIIVKVECTGGKWRGQYDPNRQLMEKQMKKEVRPLIWYPFIYFLLNIIPLINRIHNLVHPDNPELALWILTALTYPLTGGLIAVVFTLDPGTLKRLKWAEIKAAIRVFHHNKSVEEYPMQLSTEKASSEEEFGTKLLNESLDYKLDRNN